MRQNAWEACRNKVSESNTEQEMESDAESDDGSDDESDNESHDEHVPCVHNCGKVYSPNAPAAKRKHEALCGEAGAKPAKTTSTSKNAVTVKRSRSNL